MNEKSIQVFARRGYPHLFYGNFYGPSYLAATQWAGMCHAFFQLSPVIPQGDRVISMLADELRRAFAA